MYRCESWTIKKAEGQRTDAFEVWCWRRLLRVTWSARRSNQSILKEIHPEYLLEGLMLKLKLQHFGHLMQGADSLEKTLILGNIEGVRRRWWQRTRWLNGIIDSMNMSLVWTSSGSWWWTGRPGMLQSMGSQTVQHNLVTERQQGVKEVFREKVLSRSSCHLSLKERVVTGRRKSGGQGQRSGGESSPGLVKVGAAGSTRVSERRKRPMGGAWGPRGQSIKRRNKPWPLPFVCWTQRVDLRPTSNGVSGGRLARGWQGLYGCGEERGVWWARTAHSPFTQLRSVLPLLLSPTPTNSRTHMSLVVFKLLPQCWTCKE